MPYLDHTYLFFESRRSELSIVLIFVGIFSEEGLSLIKITVTIFNISPIAIGF